MGRRTLVVSRRTDGRFDCRYAHWGVDVDPLAQSRPLGREWPAEAVLAELDATYDRLLVRRGTPRTYCVCWLDPTLGDVDDIVLARTDDPEALRSWWTTARDSVVAFADAGAPPRALRAALLRALTRRADAVHPADDASFLRGDG